MPLVRSAGFLGNQNIIARRAILAQLVLLMVYGWMQRCERVRVLATVLKVTLLVTRF